MTQPTSPSVDAKALASRFADSLFSQDKIEVSLAGMSDEEREAYLIAAKAALSVPRVEPAAFDDEDRMEKISHLISRLQETKDRWGDTCVYIRRGGLSWGAVALNRQGDD